jgi:hypothetical protein
VKVLEYNKYIYNDKYTYNEGKKMAQFTTALASDFNTVRNTVTTVLGAGSGTRGYGSPIASSTVSAGQLIRPAEFTSLTTDINACYRLINGANATTLASIVQGGTVTWANFLTYQQAATFIDNNRDTNNGPVTNFAGSSLVLPAGWGNASGLRAAQATGTFSWSSAEAMRFYYNQNGIATIRASGAATGGTAKSNAFGALANSILVGAARFSYRNNIGASQTLSTNVSPYSTGAASSINVVFAPPTATTFSFVITCTDRGGDDGDFDGTTVASNVDTALTFTARPENVSTAAGITQYAPTVSFSGWSYAG